MESGVGRRSVLIKNIIWVIWVEIIKLDLGYIYFESYVVVKIWYY